MRNPFKHPKIAIKILIWFLFVALLPLGSVGYITYRMYERSLKEAAINNLITIAENKAHQIESYIFERERDVSALAHIPFIVDSIEKYGAVSRKEGVVWLDSPEYVTVDKKFRPFLTYYKERFGFSDLFFIHPDGTAIFSVMKGEDLGSNYYTGSYKGTELAKVQDRAKTLLETEISDFEFYPATNEPAAFLAAPALREGTVVGVVVFQMSNKEVYTLVQDYTGLGETGETVIASRVGDKAVFVTPLRHDPHAAFRRMVVIGSKEEMPIQEAIQGKRGAGKSIDYRGKEVLAVWRYLPYLRWGMVVKIDTKEAFASIADLRNLVFAIGIITIFVVILVAMFISKLISAPLKELTRTTQIIAGGDLEYRVNVKGSDEIGQLAASFDKMTLSLKKSQDELKERAEIEKQLAAQAATAAAEKKRAEELDKAYKQLKEMQDKLVRSEKLVILGKLTGVVGHELRNPLGTIRNSVYFLRMKLGPALEDEKIRKHLDILNEGVDISDRIITNILAFGRIKEPELAKTNINDIVKDCLEKNKVPVNIEVAAELNSQLPQIHADEFQLKQVFSNIILNAVQAMPKGGKLTIASTGKEEFIEVAITDTGEGISKENLDKIFEPLFSTKTKGIGLGLSLCQSIIENHKGTIEVKSEVGKGTKVIVKLPITKKEA